MVRKYKFGYENINLNETDPLVTARCSQTSQFESSAAILKETQIQTYS
jgi:hypothetical protein